MTTTATYTELDALLAAFAELNAVLSELTPSEWDRPTRCTPLTITQMVCHLASGQQRVNGLLAEPPSGDVTTDRFGWWRYDVSAMAPKVIESATKDSAGKSPADALAWLRSEYANVATIYADPTAKAGRKGLVINVADLASARTLETSVHTMDIAHAALKGERIAKSALPVIIEVLDGLLGATLPPSIGWDPRTYVLTATGRRKLHPNERVTLKELAAKFPLLQ